MGSFPYRKYFLPLLLAALLAAEFALAAGTVAGKLSFQGKGVKDASVLFYAVAGGRVTGAPDHEAPLSAEDGSFQLSLPPGQYFLVAKKIADDKNPGQEGDLYAYYGGNPVVVGEGEKINVGANLLPATRGKESRAAGGTGIKGKVVADGAPLSGARLTLYEDASTIFRGSGYASVVANEKGEFSFNLTPGEYYLIARKRVGVERMGPLSDGDFFGFPFENPVKVEKDFYTVLTIPTYNKLQKVREGGQDATLGGTMKAGHTTISGTVRDRSGQPVAKVYAAAYRDQMMTQKPDFISQPTGTDGTYTISVSEGADYYVGARNTLGGPVERGDLLGRFEGNEHHVVTVKTGEKITGIDVTVETVE